MNTDKVEALGTSPLNGTLTLIRQAQSKDEILRVAAQMTTFGIDIFTSFVVGGDDKEATTNSLYGRQAQLPLVEKDYYVDETTWKSIASNYTDYVTTLFKLVGRSPSDASGAADKVIQLEKSLASTQLSQFQSMNAEASPSIYLL
ncbi:hypothetical protein AC1031_021985 [Aphanomyces cochlioides]|nr:hypothetical protein AC1031_021985 [Aphanomyces cochlioides]